MKPWAQEIKTLFFDMGDTLLHFHKGPSDEWKDERGLEKIATYLQTIRPEITFDSVKNDFFIPWVEATEKQRLAHLTEYPVNEYINRFLVKYDLNFSQQECVELMDLFHYEYRSHVIFEEGLHQTLQHLKNKGFHIGVISNCYLYDEIMIRHFKKAGLHDLIDSYTFSYSLRTRKPRKEIFLEALKRAKAQPTTSIMIGDGLVPDVQGAQQVGMHGVWLKQEGEKKNLGITADHEIIWISDLLNLF